jgi:hypothetical protein
MQSLLVSWVLSSSGIPEKTLRTPDNMSGISDVATNFLHEK